MGRTLWDFSTSSQQIPETTKQTQHEPASYTDIAGFAHVPIGVLQVMLAWKE